MSSLVNRERERPSEQVKQNKNNCNKKSNASDRMSFTNKTSVQSIQFDKVEEGANKFTRDKRQILVEPKGR